MNEISCSKIERIDMGARTSRAVVYNGTVYVAGQVAKESRREGVAEQTAEVLNVVDELLKKAGSSKDKIVMVTIFLSDMAHFDGMNAVWDKWVSPGNTPARATVQAALAAPELKVEIIVTAAL